MKFHLTLLHFAIHVYLYTPLDSLLTYLSPCVDKILSLHHILRKIPSMLVFCASRTSLRCLAASENTSYLASWAKLWSNLLGAWGLLLLCQQKYGTVRICRSLNAVSNNTPSGSNCQYLSIGWAVSNEVFS